MRWGSSLLFHPLELLEKLAVLVPRPRVNLLLYHGVLAAHARGRAETVATACPPRSAVAADRGMAPPVTGSLRLPDGDSTPPSSDNRS